jgi:hypothetical protein
MNVGKRQFKMGRVIVLALLLGLAACNRSEDGGPGERAGKAVDRAIDKTGQAIERAGQKMQDAAKADQK